MPSPAVPTWPRIERRVAAVVGGAALCPGCALLPVENVAVGLCTNCWTERLTEGHEMEVATLVRQRDLDGARQRKHRLETGKSGRRKRLRLSDAALRLAER
jgi:hypothetical protein